MAFHRHPTLTLLGPSNDDYTIRVITQSNKRTPFFFRIRPAIAVDVSDDVVRHSFVVNGFAVKLIILVSGRTTIIVENGFETCSRWCIEKKRKQRHCGINDVLPYSTVIGK